MKKKSFAAALAVAAGLGIGSLTPVSAVTVTDYTINVSNGCSTGCPLTGNFGTVEVTDNGGGSFNFLVTLSSGYSFTNGSGMFGFNLTGNPDPIAYSNLSAGLDISTANTSPFIPNPPHNLDGFGNFAYQIGNTLKPGDTLFNTISFDITGGTSITTNANGWDFAIDICPTTGCGSGLTGFAATNTTCNPLIGCSVQIEETPIPGALPLFGSVLGGGYLFIRRRKKQAEKLRTQHRTQ